jgi:hypothetical protein
MAVVRQGMDRLPQQLIRAGVAQQAGAGRIGESAAAIGIHAVDRLGGGFQQQAHQILPLLQLLFAPGDGDGHAIEGLAETGQFIMPRQRGADIGFTGRQFVRRPANPLELVDDENLGQDGDGREGRQHEQQILDQLLAPDAHYPVFHRCRRQLDADQAAQFAKLVTVGGGIAGTDRFRRLGTIAVAFQAEGLHPYRRGVVIVGGAIGRGERHETLRGFRRCPEERHGIELDGVGHVRGVARPVGYVVERHSIAHPDPEVPGNLAHGMGRKEMQGLLIQGHSAFQQYLLIGAPGGHQHAVQDVSLLTQFGQDIGAAFLVVIPFEQQEERQESGAHAEPKFVAKFHCPPRVGGESLNRSTPLTAQAGPSFSTKKLYCSHIPLR